MINLYGKGSAVICGIGEPHDKSRQPAQAMQRTVSAFPLRGIEFSGATQDAYEKLTHHTGSASPLWIRLLQGHLFGSGVEAVQLETLNRARLQLAQTKLRTLRTHHTDDRRNVSVLLRAGGYRRQIIFDPSTAARFAAQDLSTLSQEARDGLPINNGFSPVLLEIGHTRSTLDIAMNALAVGASLSTAGSIGLALKGLAVRQDPLYEQSPILQEFAEKIDRWWAISTGALIAMVGLAYAIVLLRKKAMPRDITMARNADQFMSTAPPYPMMLNIMGEAHVKGFHNTLTGDLGWQHLGSGEDLFV